MEKRDGDIEPIGVLHPRAGARPFDLALRPPAPALAELVEHYWTVRWDLPAGVTHTQHTLPHPSVHLVVEPDRATVVGVMTGRFTRRLSGAGRAFGIKFRPAGFRPFLGAPVSSLTDRTVGVAEVFGRDGETLAEDLRSLDDLDRAVATADAFVTGRTPPHDPLVEEVNAIVRRIMEDRGLTRVDQLAASAELSTRALQRRLHDYVGVGPKWVIQRYRLHEAAERLAGGEPLDLALFARELGYFDQAHFVNDFRAIVGTTPARYARGENPDA